MQQQIYSVYDIKTEAFGTPFVQPNDRTAIRAFERLVLDRNSVLATHPKDYSLWRIADFNDTMGAIDDKDSSHLITSYHQVLIKDGVDYVQYVENQTEFPYSK